MDHDLAPPCACGSGLPADRCCDQDQSAITPVIVCSEDAAAELRAVIDVFNAGQAEAAAETCLRLLREQPGIVTALHLLADIRKIQAVYPAELALRRRISLLVPDSLPQLIRLVTVMVERGDKHEAMRYARRAVWMAPDDPRAHWLMALAFAHLNWITDAEYHFDIALAETKTPSYDLLLTYAEHLHINGKVEKSRELIARAEATGGVTLRSVTDTATVEALAGNLDAAEVHAKRALEGWPKQPGHCLVRAMIAEQRHDHPRALEIIEGYPAGEKPAAMQLLQGRVLGELGRIDEAFACFMSGKALERKNARQVYRPDILENQVAHARSRLTPLVMSRLPRAPRRDDVMQPLFITGFARSGTTMIEQSLSMHSRITAGGELRSTAEVIRKMGGMLGSRLSYPDALVELLVADRRHGMIIMRDDYLNNALPNATPKPGAVWFTDKSLMQEPDSPLRSLMFPDSPIINIVRHPLDSVLSVFTHQFSDGGGYSATLEGAARLYKLCAEAAEQWRLTLPQIRYMRIRHEDILADQEGEMRRVFAFIGEPYEPACLAFHENTRVAPTLSFSQVREKINDSRKYRYKKYLKHLEPIIPILEPVITMLGYTIEEA
jgi:Tfp pilus assembly protein PilF